VYDAAASCKDIILASVTNRETNSVTPAGDSYAVRHGMKVQLVTSYRVHHLQPYGDVGTPWRHKIVPIFKAGILERITGNAWVESDKRLFV